MEILSEKYPDPRTALYFNSPFELLIATILSAQSTDKQVNKVTKRLFKKYNKPADFAKLTIAELEKKINSIGLYHNKSKYIIECSKLLIKNYNGKVPRNRKELMELPGVGRKTANVVLICAFGINAFPVDTHVLRVTNRLGLVETDSPLEVEKRLCDLVPEEKWSDMHHWLIFHGRETCKARKPECQQCLIQKYCKKYQSGDIQK
jgi:endonuclease-3